MSLSQRFLIKLSAVVLVVAFGLYLVDSIWGAAAASSSDSTKSPLAIMVSKGKPTADGLGLRATVFARSSTESPVSGVMVFITTCRYGQQTPFKVFVGRKLDKANEKSTANKDSRALIWYMDSVPAYSGEPARLPLQFQVPLGMGGPTYCIRVFGLSLDGIKLSEIATLRWKL